MILKKYTVISPKGFVWEGTLVGKEGTITASAQDGRIVGGLHFKQLRDDGAVAELGISTAAAAPIVGAPSQEPGAALPLVKEAAQSLGSLPPTPVREDVKISETANGGVKAEVKADPVVAGKTNLLEGANAPVDYDALTVAQLTDLAAQRKIDLRSARLKGEIVALLAAK